MLQLLTDRNEKAAAQAEFKRQLEAQLGYQADVQIGYQGGSETYAVYSRGPGTLYYAYSPPKNRDTTPRHWNSFGIYSSTGSDGIVVEINFPSKGDTKTVAGFFARDLATGTIFVLHDGGIGGGRPGVGKIALLTWLGEELVQAVNDGQSRAGIIVGELGSPDLSNQIWRFVQKVDRFKKAATAGMLKTPAFERKAAAFARYRKEFIGTKSGSRSADFSYQTYHGAVVDALFAERDASKGKGETVGNTSLIDLQVLRDGKLLELYEVKCSSDRQSLYAAIGQLITHSVEAHEGAKRILVLPYDAEVPKDIENALAGLQIARRYYKLAGKPNARRVALL